MQTAAIPAQCPALNTLDFAGKDFQALKGAYGARKGGEWRYDRFLAGAAPSFKLAAQIDLDRFHNGEPHELDWPALFGVDPGNAAEAALANAEIAEMEMMTPDPSNAPPSLVAMALAIETGTKAPTCDRCGKPAATLTKDPCGTGCEWCPDCQAAVAEERGQTGAVEKLAALNAPDEPEVLEMTFRGTVMGSATVSTTPPQLTVEQWKLVSGAFGVLIGETDGTFEEWQVLAEVKAYLKGMGA